MKIKLSILLIFCSFHLFAQDYLTIEGKIIDKDTRKPVAYAHVGILEKGIGTVSGGNGAFMLKIPATDNRATFVVSFIGYKNFKRGIHQLENPSVIELQRIPHDLAEVIVMDEKAIEGILEKAIRKIPENYPSHPTRATGFYRESKTDSEQNYMYMAEGVLEIYKTSYEDDKEGQTRLIEGRKVALAPADELASKAIFDSGHLSGHRFDFVKNREDFIDKRYFEAYKYWIQGITSYNDRPVYVIGFDQQDDHPKGRMQGLVYIDTLSYAFLRAEFEIKEEGLKKRNDYPLYMGNWKSNRYIVNYRSFGDHWYFGGAVREGGWRDGGTYSNEFLITEIRTKKAKQLPYQQRLKRNTRFMRLTGQYDEGFWKQYNTSPLGEALSETVQQMQNQEKAAEVFDPVYMARLQAIQDSIDQAEEISILAEAAEDGDKMKKVQKKIEKIRKKRKRRIKVNPRIRTGIGVHYIPTPASNITLSYLESAGGPAIISVSNTIKERQYEFFMPFDIDLGIGKHWFIRWGFSIEYLQSIYKEHSFGVGGEVKLTKRMRPIFLRGLVQHSKHQYAVKIGQADNEFGKFKADGKKFKSDKINMYYGARTHNLKASLELALEIHPGMEFFIAGSYMLPFARKNHVFLWERDRLFFFRRRAKLDVDDRITVLKDDAPFAGEITDFNNYIFTIGVIWK